MDKNNEIMDNNIENVIGIDLGTTNTCVSIWRNGCAEVIPDEFGNRTIPSFVAYTNKNRYIGYDAKNQKDINIKNVFYEVKRLIGRKINDKFVEQEREYLSYDIVGDNNNNILLKPDISGDKLFTPEEISASILSKAKIMATNYLKSQITKCVITVPAHFNDGQKHATKDAALIAGLDCVRIINEPTAAALAYGLLERTKTQKCRLKRVLVYDFGGGTLDVSLLSIDGGIFDVLATAGNTKLGGSDFDNMMIDYVLKKFKYLNKSFDEAKLSALSLQKLRTSCEQAKQLLSSVMETHVAVKNFYENKDLCYKITRSQFESICSPLFLLSQKCVNDILNDTHYDVDDIDEVILVGGMTRVPKIRELLKLKFKKDPNCTINADEAVSIGAAIQGYILFHNDEPFSESIALLDTTALSLGVETVGGIMDTIIKRGELMPVSKTKKYTTEEDYAKSVIIRVYEGERTLTKDCFFVGEFELVGIDPVPRGIPEIEVEFNIDVNGIVSVSATNIKNKSKSSMTVTSNKGRLSNDKIKELIEEANKMAIYDELEKRKKNWHYEIGDMCSNVTYNIKNKLINLSETNVKLVEEDIQRILNWVNEKEYYQREDEEYIEMREYVMKKYTMLIVKGSTDDNLKCVNNNKDKENVTAIYDDEEDEKEIENIFEKLENDEMGFDGMNDPEKDELKELKKTINTLCHDMMSLICENNINMEKEHILELRDYMDDTLMWLHIHHKTTKQEYIDKLNEINKSCDKIFEYYSNNNVNIFKEDIYTAKTKREELENMCFGIKITIDDNYGTINHQNINKINEFVTETINWLYEINNNDSDNSTNDILYEEKINKLNELSNDLYAYCQGLDLTIKKEELMKNNVMEKYDEFDKFIGGKNECGTSVFELAHRQALKEMEQDLANENNE
jgi:molecular chaperone DnaK (HSP70)